MKINEVNINQQYEYFFNHINPMKKETWDSKEMNVIGYFHTKYIGMYYYIMDKTEEEIKNALKLVIEKYQDYKKKELSKNDIAQCNGFLIVETKLCRSLGIPEPLVYVILFFMTINKAIDEEEALINKERFSKAEFQNLLVYMYHIETLTESFHSKTGYDYLVSSIDQAKGGKKKNENYKEIKDFLKKETKLLLKENPQMNNQTIAFIIRDKKLPGFEGKNPWIDSKLDEEEKSKVLKDKEETIYNRFVRWIPKIKKNEDF